MVVVSSDSSLQNEPLTDENTVSNEEPVVGTFTTYTIYTLTTLASGMMMMTHYYLLIMVIPLAIQLIKPSNGLVSAR